VIFPVTAFLLYQRLGNPAAIDNRGQRSGHNVTEAQIVTMVETLAQTHATATRRRRRLAACSLARTRRSSAFPNRRTPTARAAALIKNDANLLADYATCWRWRTAAAYIAGEPFALIQRALAIDPHQRKALGARRHPRRWKRATCRRRLTYWRRLAAELPADPRRRRKCKA
jgi:hypothetical protein